MALEFSTTSCSDLSGTFQKNEREQGQNLAGIESVSMTFYMMIVR